MTASRPPLAPTDPVATAIEAHLRNMERDGYGKLQIEPDGDDIKISFGPLALRAETCDIAFVRLASLILDHPKLSVPFMDVLRGLQT